MPGERDLPTILATLDVARRPGVFHVIEVVSGTPAPAGTAAMIDEGEMTTFVVDEQAAATESPFPAAWLTLTVHTSLEAVGLTAAVATALAEVGIAANVLAGYRHDHLLVPAARADDAVAAIRALRDGAPLARDRG